MTGSPAVVYDANIFIQALAAPSGPAGRCVHLALTRSVSRFVLPFVLTEIRAVAARPKVASKLRIDAERVEALLTAIQFAATLPGGFAAPFAYARDPDDAQYINLRSRRAR